MEKRKPCLFWTQLGQCKKGQNCKHLHIGPPGAQATQIAMTRASQSGKQSSNNNNSRKGGGGGGGGKSSQGTGWGSPPPRGAPTTQSSWGSPPPSRTTTPWGSPPSQSSQWGSQSQPLHNPTGPFGTSFGGQNQASTGWNNTNRPQDDRSNKNQQAPFQQSQGKVCRAWATQGSCKYGARCQFLHTDGRGGSGMDVDRMDARRVKDKPNQAATQRPVFGQSTFGQTPQQGASQNRASGPMQQGGWSSGGSGGWSSGWTRQPTPLQPQQSTTPTRPGSGQFVSAFSNLFQQSHPVSKSAATVASQQPTTAPLSLAAQQQVTAKTTHTLASQMDVAPLDEEALAAFRAPKFTFGKIPEAEPPPEFRIVR